MNYSIEERIQKQAEFEIFANCFISNNWSFLQNLKVEVSINWWDLSCLYLKISLNLVSIEVTTTFNGQFEFWDLHFDFFVYFWVPRKHGGFFQFRIYK